MVMSIHTNYGTNLDKPEFSLWYFEFFLHSAVTSETILRISDSKKSNKAKTFLMELSLFVGLQEIVRN